MKELITDHANQLENLLSSHTEALNSIAKRQLASIEKARDAFLKITDAVREALLSELSESNLESQTLTVSFGEGTKAVLDSARKALNTKQVELFGEGFKEMPKITYKSENYFREPQDMDHLENLENIAIIEK